MEIRSAYILKQYPNAGTVPKRHKDAIEWQRIFYTLVVGTWLAALVVILAAWQAYRLWDQRAAELAEARERILGLSGEIERLQVMSYYSAEQALELAAAMQKVVLSGSGFQQDFMAAMLPAALKAQITHGVPASATMAMSIYESGYGKSELARSANNFFGLKAFASVWDGPKVYQQTRDLGRKTMAYFRSYPDVDAAVMGYADFLKAPRYAKAFEFKTGPEFVETILRAGYCPDGDYLSNIKTIMERHHLAELDLARPLEGGSQQASLRREEEGLPAN
jgi:flagellum-specific peptidoglycan hydrolase FlgJ